MDKLYIVSNQIECLSCGDKPYSAHRHDFQSCKCGKVAVDGGQEYTRRVGASADWKDISILMEEKNFQELCKELGHAVETGRNPLGLACAALRSLRDLGYTVKPPEEVAYGG